MKSAFEVENILEEIKHGKKILIVNNQEHIDNLKGLRSGSKCNSIYEECCRIGGGMVKIKESKGSKTTNNDYWLSIDDFKEYLKLVHKSNKQNEESEFYEGEKWNIPLYEVRVYSN